MGFRYDVSFVTIFTLRSWLRRIGPRFATITGYSIENFTQMGTGSYVRENGTRLGEYKYVEDALGN
jgi:hypothetical protein